MRYAPIALIITILLSGCGDTNIIIPPTGPTPIPVVPVVPVPVTKNRVEFRVVGNATSARIRYSNSLDGLVQVVTSLPYSASYTTDQTTMFLSLEVTPGAYGITTAPFMSAQIVVNGVLFREGTSNDFLLNTISVSGTWRQ